MAKITFAKTQTSIEAPPQANLMQTLLKAELPVASSCGGEGICGKCIIRIVGDDSALSPMNDQDLNLMEKIDIPADCRVSCQTQVNSEGVVTVDTDYW